MSYAQRKDLSGNRTISIIFTAVVVGGLMYAIVTGLAYNVIKKSVQDLKTSRLSTSRSSRRHPSRRHRRRRICRTCLRRRLRRRRW